MRASLSCNCQRLLWIIVSIKLIRCILVCPFTCLDSLLSVSPLLLFQRTFQIFLIHGDPSWSICPQQQVLFQVHLTTPLAFCFYSAICDCSHVLSHLSIMKLRKGFRKWPFVTHNKVTSFCIFVIWREGSVRRWWGGGVQLKIHTKNLQWLLSSRLLVTLKKSWWPAEVLPWCSPSEKFLK